MKSGATASIPVAMLIKKFYCHQCGQQLKIQKVTRTLTPGDPDCAAAEKEIFDLDTLPKGSISVTKASFVCPFCHAETTIEAQKEIAKQQKQAGTRIL
jgi:transcription elongation factor Elf1